MKNVWISLVPAIVIAVIAVMVMLNFASTIGNAFEHATSTLNWAMRPVW